jgi:hypothetical protein
MAIGWLHRHPRIVDWALFLIAAVTTIGAAARHARPAIGAPSRSSRACCT